MGKCIRSGFYMQNDFLLVQKNTFNQSLNFSEHFYFLTIIFPIVLFFICDLLITYIDMCSQFVTPTIANLGATKKCFYILVF